MSKIGKDLYCYKRNLRKIRDYRDQIEVLETIAAKMTRNFEPKEGSGSLPDGSRLEECVCKIIEIEKKIRITEGHVKSADAFLDSLKPYQRHIVKLCIVDHIPYENVAKMNKTTAQNIRKIIDNAL